MSQNWFANANATPRNTRNCAACFRARAIKHFSTNQKSKGANSHCHSCVASGYGGGLFECECCSFFLGIPTS